MSSNGDGGHDAVDYFESSLETLFGQHQPATGEPGQLCGLHLSSDDDGKDERITYRIPNSGTNRLFAHYQWDAGLFLCRLIHSSLSKSISPQHLDADLATYRREADVRGLRVLELGAGTGLPGLISAKYGASNVVITDYPDPGLLAGLEENIRLFDVTQQAHAIGLDWADVEAIASLQQAYPHGFDRILCADVLWLSSSHEPLLRTIRALLARTPTARCIVVSGFHTGRRAITHFFRLAASSEEPNQQSALVPSTESNGIPTVFEYNVVTKATRAWSGKSTFLDGLLHGPTEREGMEDESQDSMDDYTERAKWLSYVSLQWAVCP